MKIHTVQLHLGDLVGGTAHMDGAEFGAYMLLIVACYQSSTHRLPDEDSRLCRMARVTPHVWARIRKVVMNKFIHRNDLNGAWFEHDRVNFDAAKYKSKSSTNSANALKRWNSEMPVASESVCERNATQDPRPKTQDIKPPSSLPSSREGAGFKNENLGRAFDIIPLLSDSGLAAAKAAAPDWDIYNLARIYNDGSAERGRPDNPNAAFIGWVRNYTKGKKP